MMLTLGSIVAFALIALCTFANTLNHPFVHDDIVFVLHNPNIARFNDLWSVFFSPGAAPFGEMNIYFRPMLELLYRLEYALYGFNPVGWHLCNILLHGFNGALLMRLLVLIGFTRTVGFATALLFIVHPIQTESVACIAGVSNLLMAAFVFGCLISYLRGRWGGSIICFFFALLTKEQAVMVVPLMVLIDWCRGRVRLLWWSGALLLMLAILSLRQALTGSHLLSDIIASPDELKLRLLTIAQVILTDLRMMFLPYDLHYYRSVDILNIHWRWWAGLAALLLVLLLLRRRFLWFGLGFFLAALLPVLNIVPLVNEYSLIQSMEHFLYIPMAGIMLVLVCAIALYCRRHTEQIFLIFVVCFFFLALIQNEYWRSEIVLFERTVEFEPDFGRAHHLLAGAYYFDKNYSYANDHFARAYAIMEGYSRKVTDAPAKLFLDRKKKEILSDWAHSYDEMGYWDMAQRKYKEAAIIDPKDPKIWNDLAVLYAHMGRFNDAVTCFERALKIDPSFTLARENLRHLR